mgnify:FL=1|jgi:ABC-2 type transport system ATP-binding protein
MSIKIKNLTKYYGNEIIIPNISFELKKGEIVAMLGPNGAGKSTIMKIITCYVNESKGEVQVCGFKKSNNSINIKRKIGYLPENNPLYLNMYPKEYLLFLAKMYNVKNQKIKVEEVMKETGLEFEKNKKISSLSKGYRQRIGLAGALIHNPEVLILDEPTTGLDPNQLKDIRELIRKNGKNKTVLISTHIMQEVEKLCDRILFINNGCIVADRLVSDLKQESIDLESYFNKLTTKIEEK